jgi:uncharacterized protein (TIGR03067 family)
MLLLLVGLSLSPGAPALKERPAPEPALVGEWVPESVTVNGRSIRPGSDRWVFRADGMWGMWSGGKEVDAGSFTWDPKGSPGTIDLTSASNTRPADLCRYRVDGDALVLSVGHVQGERPADLQPARKVTVWVFKRVTPKD